MQAGQALVPIWFGAAGLMVLASGAVADWASGAFIVTSLLGASIFLFGVPSLVMPPAFRGSFRGWLRGNSRRTGRSSS